MEVERSKPVRAVLDRLVDRFAERSSLSLEDIEAEARAARCDGWSLPKRVEWLNVEALPAVRSRYGSDVGRDIVEWVLGTAVKTNDIEPSAALLDFVSHVQPDDAHALGDALFRQWLEEDQRTLSIEEARELAEERRVIRGIGHTFHRDLDEVMTEILSMPAGTALPSKGLLSVVAACGAPSAGERVDEYLDHWGISPRKKQCIALLKMLGWTKSPTATATVVRVAQGHWLDSVQKQAVESTRTIAQRENWDEQTLQDHLAERGELNDDGEMILDSGSQSFHAKLQPDLRIRVRERASGAVVRSIPEEHIVKPWMLRVSRVGNQRLAKTRRAVRRSVERERKRFDDAKVVERRYDGDHFATAILAHPVLRLLAAEHSWRLADESNGATCQVMPDRSLQRADGTLVDPSGNCLICVAD